MFIETKDSILYFDGKHLSKLEGEKKDILSIIKKKYIKLTGNVCIDYMCNRNGHGVFRFYDIQRQSIVCVSTWITKKNWIEKTYRMLHDFTAQRHDKKFIFCNFYGNLPQNNWRKKMIKSMKELYNASLFSKEIKLENSNLYGYETSFSFELGTYKKLYIWNVWWWISNQKKIAKEKSISESLERLSASIALKGASKSYDIKKNKWLKKICLLNSITTEKIEAESCPNLIPEADPTLIPAELLYYPHYWKIFWFGATSSWMATHYSKELALQWWIFELIERDAFLLFWILKKWQRIIPFNLLSPKNKKTIIESNQYDIDLFLLEFDNPVPVVLTILKSGKKTLVWLWVDFDLQEAISKSLWELLYWWWLLYTEFTNAKPWSIDYHINYYLQEKNFKNIKWVYQCKKIDRLPQYTAKTINQIVNYYKKKKKSFYWKEYTNKALKEFNRCTYRVISDSLLPIFFDKNPPIGIITSSRISYWEKKLDVKKFNKAPHPLW